MKKRIKGHLYFLQDLRRVKGVYRYVGTDDGTLFSANYGRTKIYASELPEWFVYGRFYKRFGYLSTKGIKAVRYVPNWHSNHFLKDDHLQISYDKTESELGDYWEDTTWVWGSEILDVLKGAQIYSTYDITPIICQLKEKVEWLRKAHPEEFSEEKWRFDLEKWKKEPLKNGLPPRYAAVLINSCFWGAKKETLYGSEDEIKKFIENLPSNYGNPEETIQELQYIKKSFDYLEGFELESVNSQGEPYELQFYSSLLSQILLRDGDKYELCASAEIIRFKYRKKGCQLWTESNDLNTNPIVEKANPEGTNFKTKAFIRVKTYDSAKEAVSEMWDSIPAMTTVVKYIFGAIINEG
ncbi:MAG: hypothetical protein OSJ36_09840 [Odoribacter sp.]|nr:hypothetical protein [Odoribacter sp.]